MYVMSAARVPERRTLSAFKSVVRMYVFGGYIRRHARDSTNTSKICVAKVELKRYLVWCTQADALSAREALLHGGVRRVQLR